MIRKARTTDVEDLIRLCEKFAREASAPIEIDRGHVRKMILEAIASPRALVLVLDIEGPAGLFVAYCHMSMIAPVMVAEEVIFWIDHDYRGRWVRAFMAEYELWASHNGARLASMVTLASMDASKLFIRMGYQPTETRMMKVI